MASETIELADRLVFTVTGRHLNDLQRTILRQVWQGQKYLDIANTAGYTEGHIKDVAYQMWRRLSRVTSLGLYHLDLWNLEAATTWFSQVIATATGTRHQPWADKATTCLALVRSYQGQPDAAQTLADSVIEQVRGRGQSGRHAFFVQLLGHTYLNLGDLATAEALFKAAIQAAAAGHYLQIKANTLLGLGRLKKHQGNLAGAVEDCQGAIVLLDEVGAHGDLATAHLQCALTLACLPGPAAEAEAHLDQALDLFQAIPAPHQVARAKQAWAQRDG
ncbi:MAG: hypothetical protein ACOYM4_06175 [Nodosilinea sp.]|jgi:tetratricopeptide (TPR) repeat protein